MLWFPRSQGADHIMNLYEYLGTGRVLFLYGVMGSTDPILPRIDPFSPHFLADAILALNKQSLTSPIWLFIDSPGGFVDDGLILYDAIKTSMAPVHTVGKSCYSMAAVILSAGAGGYRYLYPHSRVMIHQVASRGVPGSESDQRIHVKQMSKLKSTIADLMIENGVSKPKATVIKDMDREYWMSAEETISYGMADRIINGRDLYSPSLLPSPVALLQP